MHSPVKTAVCWEAICTGSLTRQALGGNDQKADGGQRLEYGSWSFDLEAHKEQEYDRLADLVRRSFDMKKIYEILEEGI